MLANEFKLGGQFACLRIRTRVWIKTDTLIIIMTIDPRRKNTFSDESITLPSNMYMILED